MTDDTRGSPEAIDLPADVVARLNSLGFVLIESGPSNAFVRSAFGSEVRVTVSPPHDESWRVGVAWRPATEVGRLPYALTPMSIAALGPSVDGVTLDLSTTALLNDLPRLLGESLLPLVDLAPS